MGRTVTPKYRLEYRGVALLLSDAGPVARGDEWGSTSAWTVRERYGRPGDGVPSDANLAKFVQVFEESCRTGSNRHISETRILFAEIIEQATGDVKASYSNPMT